MEIAELHRKKKFILPLAGNLHRIRILNILIDLGLRH